MEIFHLEEKNWVQYVYKNGELTDIPAEVTDTCEENELSYASCAVCGEEISMDKFREWAWGKK